MPGTEQIQHSMAPGSPESAEAGGSSGPPTPPLYKGGKTRSPEEAALLRKALQGKHTTTGQESSETASTISASQASNYTTTKSVGQIAVGTALITQVSCAAHAGCFEGLDLDDQRFKVFVKLSLCLVCCVCNICCSSAMQQLLLDHVLRERHSLSTLFKLLLCNRRTPRQLLSPTA